MRAMSDVEGVRRWIGNEAAKQGETRRRECGCAPVSTKANRSGPLGYPKSRRILYGVSAAAR